VDYHSYFLPNGVNTAAGWMSDDCAHPTTLGHHELRRLIWAAWTDQWH